MSKSNENEIINKDEILSEIRSEAAKIIDEAKAEASKIINEAKSVSASVSVSSGRTVINNADAYNDMVKIKLFKDTGKYTDDVFVAVNGHRYQIQRGIEVLVPRCVAEVISNQELQDSKTSAMIKELVDAYETSTKSMA